MLSLTHNRFRLDMTSTKQNSATQWKRPIKLIIYNIRKIIDNVQDNIRKLFIVFNNISTDTTLPEQTNFILLLLFSSIHVLGQVKRLTFSNKKKGKLT